MNFATYQREVWRTDKSRKASVSLLGLVGEIGDLQSVIKKSLVQNRYPTFHTELAEEVGDTLWYLSSIATSFHLSLNTIARDNLAKARQFHAPGRLNKFDRSFPEDERLPRKFEVVFVERSLRRKSVQVKIRINGVFVGDVLTDNSKRNDGYRYHDAFHFAYAAVLGWSPVVRTILKRKRKSKPRVDEIEDGARAATVEEAIAIFLFNQAKYRDFYREEKAIDLSLLKTVTLLCKDLEVRACKGIQWRNAIFKGFEMYRKLQKFHGGTLRLNLDKESIEFIEPSTRRRSTPTIRARPKRK